MEPKITWEYKVVEISNDMQLLGKLNGFGKEGWELTAVVPTIMHLGRISKYTLYFKRSIHQ
ncbi:DUF4177 domain-containing protein [Alicyclobacillus sendaiensis]|uniref:DUF4177 domain-containing protein n=1 Tax=Alicyclobacillus sendaiensis TaxID=192387 RepID=UPI0009F98392|nr:DUF4177 domain-containing protein [Alicyclobacillus sendaiensis]